MATSAKVVNQPKGVRSLGRERRTCPNAKPATDIVFIPSMPRAAALPDIIHGRIRGRSIPSRFARAMHGAAFQLETSGMSPALSCRPRTTNPRAGMTVGSCRNRLLSMVANGTLTRRRDDGLPED